MPKGIKIALTGKNALTNNNPEDFSLFVDGTNNHILIKEKTRDTVSVDAFITESIATGLTYEPLVAVQVEVSSGEFQYVYGLNAFVPFRAYIESDNLKFRNGESSSKDFTYIIFHDAK